MSLNDDIVDKEKSDGIGSLSFVVNDFSGLFVNLSTFFYQRFKICVNNGVLSNLWYWLNSNILPSSEVVKTLQKALFLYKFLCETSLFPALNQWRKLNQ